MCRILNIDPDISVQEWSETTRFIGSVIWLKQNVYPVQRQENVKSCRNRARQIFVTDIQQFDLGSLEQVSVGSLIPSTHTCKLLRRSVC